jgi:hypothetical protein
VSARTVRLFVLYAWALVGCLMMIFGDQDHRWYGLVLCVVALVVKPTDGEA